MQISDESEASVSPTSPLPAGPGQSASRSLPAKNSQRPPTASGPVRSKTTDPARSTTLTGPPSSTTSAPPSTSTTTSTTGVPAPETPAPITPNAEIPSPEPTVPTEQELCANLGLVAVGDPAVGDAEAAAAWNRFRAAIPQIPATDHLRCGKPVARFLDDLLIQRVQVAGEGFGILVGGLDPADPVLWMSEIEWTSYKWMFPNDSNHNFTGVPVGRQTIGVHPIIRTSRGAVVMVRSDSWGHTVVSGAWDAWMASGGPNGPMGLPEGRAIKDPQGAHQDFTNGVLKLPGVTSELEAEVLPASRYVWVPLTAEELATPPPAVNSIQDVYKVSYYVDRHGVRHWIETTSDWSCARNNLGAVPVTEHEVGEQEPIPLPGWQAARAPLGPAFTCPRKAPA